MKNDFKEEWIRNVEFEESEDFPFKELAIGILFCALCIAVGIAVLLIRRGCVGI